MAQILDWKKVSLKRKEILKQEFTKPFWNDKFLAIFFLWDNVWSATYVKMKKKFGKSVWLEVKVFGQQNEFENHLDIIAKIQDLNKNDNCVGIMVQLPLPKNLADFQTEILSVIDTKKDVDWLGGRLLWLWMLWFTDVLPATPSWCFKLLWEYWYQDFTWKICSVFGQSNLIWKPLCTQLMKLGATVFSFNSKSNLEIMKECSLKSDFLFSCTWKIFLINEEFIRKDNSQIIIDIWRGKKDWKAVGDVEFDKIIPFIKSYTPVPWWVGPMTILSIFENIVSLNN